MTTGGLSFPTHGFDMRAADDAETAPTTMCESGFRGRLRAVPLGAFLIFIAALAPALVAGIALHGAVSETSRLRFDAEVLRSEAAVRQRMHLYRNALKTGAATDDVLKGMLGPGSPTINLSIKDAASDFETTASLGTDASSAEGAARHGQPAHSVTTYLVIDGHPWILSFSSNDDFLTALEKSAPAVTLATGLAAGTLAFLIVMRASLSRRRADARATRRNDALQAAKAAALHRAETETQRRRQQEFANLQLQNANKALTAFASIAAHDIVGPVRRIDTMVDILREDHAAALDVEAHDLLARMHTATRRTLDMVSGLLAYSKCGTTALNMSAFPARRFFESVAGELLADETATIEIVCDDALTLFADCALLEHVVRNILSNSMKYRSATPLAITILVEPADGAISISISDNGIGIDEQYADRVFDMFCRLHGTDKFEGAGIGLAICQRIVDHHNGRIWIDKTYRDGTCVMFTVPTHQTVNNGLLAANDAALHATSSHRAA